ncbi:MAG: DNA polymerase IV, partial [Hyphomonadaceae bacterium]
MILCRTCAALGENAPVCSSCGEDRIIAHDELKTLALAHIDCDAFYASIEKRDDP